MQSSVCLQVVEKPADPRNFSGCVGPHFHVLKRSLEGWAAQLRLRHTAVNCGGELQVQRSIVFRQHVLPISFFTHLDIRDRIMAFVKISNFIRGIFWCRIQHGNRDHGGKSARHAAGEEEIEADLVASRLVHI